MTTQQQIIAYLKADPTRRICIANYKGVECYSAPQPIGSGILSGSAVEQLLSTGKLVRENNTIKLA